MRKPIHLEELDPKTQTRIIGSLHEQGLIQDLRAQGKNSREIIDALARQHAQKRRRTEAKPTKQRPWYIQAFRLWMFTLGYTAFVIGWLLEYGGYYLKRLGEETNKAARSL
jgi:hypothetical protein